VVALQLLRKSKQVADHKSLFFRSAWARYNTARTGTLRLSPHPNRIGDLRAGARLGEFHECNPLSCAA
jgi:hypothetical protein